MICNIMKKKMTAKDMREYSIYFKNWGNKILLKTQTFYFLQFIPEHLTRFLEKFFHGVANIFMEILI